MGVIVEIVTTIIILKKNFDQNIQPFGNHFQLWFVDDMIFNGSIHRVFLFCLEYQAFSKSCSKVENDQQI